jgi:hypothetical protein
MEKHQKNKAATNPQNCASHCITYLVPIIPPTIIYKLIVTIKVVTDNFASMPIMVTVLFGNCAM